jgi:hypothetical protein
MRDEYPPFRLDQGGSEPEPAPSEMAPATAEPIPGEEATAEAPPERGGWTAGRIVLIVVGVIAGIVAFALLVGGCALVAVDRTQRDDDGFLMSPTQSFDSPTYAIVSQDVDIDSDGEWALDAFLGTVRIRSESDRPVFVGIGPAADVDGYVQGVGHDVVDDLDSSGDPEYQRRPGAEPSAPPGTQTFWAASTSGAGEQTLDWDPQDGDWRAIVMNQDASRDVAADMSIGAELDSVLWIGLGLLVFGGLLAGAAALSITAAVRRRTA